MDFHINGKQFTSQQSGLTISQALALKGITRFGGIAVAVNQVIVPKIRWCDWSVNPNDQMLIIAATQGG